MKTYFQVKGWFKHYEQDVFKDGCLPETASCISGDDIFTGKTPKEIIKECMDFVGVVDINDCLLDSCENKGRLDIQTLETDDSLKPSEHQINEWKNENLRLWACTYIFDIKKITEKDVSIINELAHFKQNKGVKRF